MGKNTYINPADFEYVDRVYIVTLTLADNEEPPSITELVNVIYQGVPALNSEDAVLVERMTSS